MASVNFKKKKGYLFKTIHLEEIVNPETKKVYTKEVVKRESIANKPDLYIVTYHGNGELVGLCYDTSQNRLDTTKNSLASILTPEEYFKEFQELPPEKQKESCYCDLFPNKKQN